MFLYKKKIDYKYQLSQVITKYIRKQFEYSYIMILGVSYWKVCKWAKQCGHSPVATYGQTDRVHTICLLVCILWIHKIYGVLKLQILIW